MKKQSMKHLDTCKERSALTRQKALLNFLKKLLKSVDSLCMRCYNIQVSRESYALDEGGRLMQLCRENSVPVENTETMLEIGRACGINVKAAAAAILKADKGLA